MPTHLQSADIDRAHNIVVEDYDWYRRQEFRPWRKDFVEQEMPPLDWLRSFTDSKVTIVDIHD
jgi:hypothetical protein